MRMQLVGKVTEITAAVNNQAGAIRYVLDAGETLTSACDVLDHRVAALEAVQVSHQTWRGRLRWLLKGV